VTSLDDLRALIERIVDERVQKALAALKPQNDEYLSTASAAEYADVSTKTIRRWIEAGRLQPHRAGRKLLVRRADLDRLLDEGGRDHELTPEQLADRDFR
jgi:excisionase family DNA binding protein